VVAVAQVVALSPQFQYPSCSVGPVTARMAVRFWEQERERPGAEVRGETRSGAVMIAANTPPTWLNATDRPSDELQNSVVVLDVAGSNPPLIDTKIFRR
jgi:hypothetical protein